MSTEVVALTGAAGRIGRSIAPRLARPGRELRLSDLVAPSPPVAGFLACDLGDLDALTELFTGAHAVVHLGGLSSEASWADILRVNVDGTRNVLEAARRAGVRSVLLASSIHAVGFAPVGEAGSPMPIGPRPDTYYGVSKAAMEALGSLYADRFGLSVVSARICTFQESPGDGRAAAQWLSPDDAARLADAAIALRDGCHHIVWGVSANAPSWFSLDAGAAIGYLPKDDAVALRRQSGAPLAEFDETEPLGASFTRPDHPVGEAW
ncbi:NAD-dependent epimerase/dehydratase family protein [Microbacterium stercoris]|uniref:NAD(P)-dependent oxidoreductase n=1 Tax=Microbacterium stercoris TaxID=2820289 RepID=A0A939QIE4_9MICO|nr:NAD(P)-dependent oxidoreductase [Microbacterium stercoris]MBO3662232.1 NAD(P)-dependent oxidoreductase [Microbacterium stercoris]